MLIGNHLKIIRISIYITCICAYLYLLERFDIILKLFVSKKKGMQNTQIK
jgi:hypothetical protein